MPPDNIKKQFQSDIPDHLLTNADPQSKWLMENMSVVLQATDYLVSEQTKQSDKLEKIEKQVNHTNGRLLKAEGEISEVKEILKEDVEIKQDVKQIVAAKRLIEKLGKSKYFWIILGFLIVGTITVFKNPMMQIWLGKFL